MRLIDALYYPQGVAVGGGGGEGEQYTPTLHIHTDIISSQMRSLMNRSFSQ